MTPKDRKIIEDAEKNNTPIFVFTAKDKISTFAIESYLQECEHSGCSLEHLKGINERINEFLAWQEKNNDKVKLPD